MNRLLAPENDTRIRAALRDANQQGKLSVVAAVTGRTAEELRKIMGSTEPLTLMDRGTLGSHLGNP